MINTKTLDEGTCDWETVGSWMIDDMLIHGRLLL